MRLSFSLHLCGICFWTQGLLTCQSCLSARSKLPCRKQKPRLVIGCIRCVITDWWSGWRVLPFRMGALMKCTRWDQCTLLQELLETGAFMCRHTSSGIWSLLCSCMHVCIHKYWFRWKDRPPHVLPCWLSSSGHAFWPVGCLAMDSCVTIKIRRVSRFEWSHSQLSWGLLEMAATILRDSWSP